MRHQRLVLLATVILLTSHACAQNIDSTFQTISSKYLDKVALTSSRVERKLEKKSEKTLKQWQKQEAKLKRKLVRLDSINAKVILGDVEQQCQMFGQRLERASSKQYLPAFDTLVTSIKFLQQSPQFLATTKEAAKKLTDASAKLKALEGRFQKAEEIKNFLKERRQNLKEPLEQLGSGSYRYAKQVRQLNKQAYYYSQQVNEYKELLKDHTRAEKKAISLLSETKLFRDFMKKNSMLAGLFPVPGGEISNQASQAGFAGLQTRSQLSTFLQQTGISNINTMPRLQQNIKQADAQLTQLRNKLSQLTGAGSNDLEMPDFKPNAQKTKSFFQRLELGTTIQSQKANRFFPSTSDIGLSVGYKLNDKSIIGIGASYKVGLGRGWDHINLSHQGAGLRSFIDYKIKGSFWLSGGYEQNFRQFPEVAGTSTTPPLGGWGVQQSGLLGMSKTISLQSKLLKKTKLQLFWDFLSYEQVPRSQPLLFRVGYSF